MYNGTIHKKGKAIALAHGIPYVILSAKYGFIKPTTVIEYYDQKFEKPFKGWAPVVAPWHGFVCGGQGLYFKHAPKRFESLTPKLPLGEMQRYLKILETSPDIVQNLIVSHLARFPE